MMLLASFKSLLAMSQLVKLSLQHNTPFPNSAGFSNPTYSTSTGGFANCISGHVQVHPTATNMKVLFAAPVDQYAVTTAFVHYLQANSTQAAEVNGGPAVISQTFNIAVKFCIPKGAASLASTVQFLVHGIGFNQSYWDFAKGNSFVDIAAKAGYPTFSFDRLGVGASDHPDPIQIVQAPLQVEIAHSLVTLLRAGAFCGQKFKDVVGVAHSFGSIQSVGLLAGYPKDLDAVVLTGFSTDAAALGLTFADFNPTIAAQNQPARFSGLPNGFPESYQTLIDNLKVFLKVDANKQTYTLGELFTLTSVIVPTAFTGPVFAVIGQFDFVFAQGNADYPSNQAALVQPILFPNASKNSQSYIVPGAGHAINLHYEARLMFDQVQAFVKKSGY